MKSKLFASVAAAVVGAMGLATVANAGSLVLADDAGKSVGWTASWNDTSDSDFTLKLQTIVTGQDRVVFKKVATFGPGRVDSATGTILPIEIVFQQTSYDAKPLIVVNTEVVTNHTGMDWNAFQMTIVDGTSGMANQASFEASSFGPPAPFAIAPFTSYSLGKIPGLSNSADNQNLILSGGVVADGQVWHAGDGGSQGQLVINARPVKAGAYKSFVFEEQPMTSVVIPLPAAAWTGLSGLAGLMLVGAARKARNLVA